MTSSLSTCCETTRRKRASSSSDGKAKLPNPLPTSSAKSKAHDLDATRPLGRSRARRSWPRHPVGFSPTGLTIVLVGDFTTPHHPKRPRERGINQRHSRSGAAPPRPHRAPNYLCRLTRSREKHSFEATHGHSGGSLASHSVARSTRAWATEPILDQLGNDPPESDDADHETEQELNDELHDR